MRQSKKRKGGGTAASVKKKSDTRQAQRERKALRDAQGAQAAGANDAVPDEDEPLVDVPSGDEELPTTEAAVSAETPERPWHLLGFGEPKQADGGKRRRTETAASADDPPPSNPWDGDASSSSARPQAESGRGAKVRRRYDAGSPSESSGDDGTDAKTDVPLERTLAQCCEVHGLYAAKLLYKGRLGWITLVQLISHDATCCYPRDHDHHLDGCSTQSCTTFQNNYPRHTPVDLKRGGCGGM
jgi:hypothetical protein